MSKLDELKRTMGGNVAESASRRETTAIPAATLAGLNPARMDGVSRSKAAMEIPIDRIDRDPDQPREEFEPEALARLADSIRARGLLQPVRVRWSEDQGRYVLIAGERRWRASKMAGLPTLTCIVADGELSPAELLADQVTENLLREDLTPSERAKAYRTLMSLNGWSGNQLAKELGVSQPGVVVALSVLELPEAVQDLMDRGKLSPSLAPSLAKLPNPEAQVAMANRIVADGLTRDQAVEEIRQDAEPKGGGGKGREASKARKKTSETFRVAGYKITAENKRGIEEATLLAALIEATEQHRAKMQGRGEAAA